MNGARLLLIVGLAISGIGAGFTWQQDTQSAQTGPAPHAKVVNPHGALAIPCQNCHTNSGWKPIRAIPEFNHDRTGYPLRGMHKGVTCMQCHSSLVFHNVGIHCADCHADIHRGQMGANCESCHSVAGWQVSLEAIRNHQNRFPLVGAHALVDCVGCHTGAAVGQFKGLSTACISCHEKDYHTPVIDHVALGFSTTCESCHTMDTWFSAKFDHLKYTGYALTGAHATLPCTACHINNQFKNTPADCFSCHSSDFTGTNSPPHVQANLPHDCAICHSTVNWQNASFNHALYANYPLTGLHASLTCAQCHINNQYVGTSTACYSCHKADYQSAANPNHAAAGFPTDCTICHTTAGWAPSSFDHSTTGFVLAGAHASLLCSACHTNNDYSGNLPTNCYSCHVADWNGTTNPNHAAAGFPTTCATCHTTVTWDGAIFDHSKTPFPLTGAHASVACSQCHVNNVFAGTPTACYACHKADYTSATNPNHAAAGFPTNCTFCHTTVAWTPTSFDHSTTGFTLTGAHTSLLCSQCHTNNNFSGNLPTTCYGCHTADWNSTNNPSHAAAGFPTTCNTCHTTVSWSGAVFNHNNTPFPLTGAHVNVACSQCHVNNVFAGTPTACYACHKADYTSATNPNHAAAGFPTDCTFCHTTVAWTPASFDHSTTGFTLTGAHTTLLCSQCHTNNNFSGNLPTTCYGCHTADWNSTNNPSHAAAGFPTTCNTCHTTVSWSGAVFNHNNTPFPLTGAHVNVACNQCHINNVFAGTPTDCYSCHKADYSGTTNPNHVSAGFPTTCATCHTTASWLGATFNHTWFNMNHGGANGVCSTCHTNSSDYSVFTCTNCHTKTKTDSEHQGISGYVYNSVNCYSCHKNAGGG